MKFEGLTETELRSRLESIATQVAALSQELKGYLGRPVNIMLTSNGLGFTAPVANKEAPVTINVNPRAILEGHRDGPQILRGLGWHEAGHQKLHEPKALEKALREGGDVRQYQAVIQDEHLERRIRSEREDVGMLFDKLLKYMRETGLWRLDRDRSSQEEFSDCLRMHNPAQRPAVVKALSLIPKNLKELSDWDLLDLSRKVKKVLDESAEEEKRQQEQEPQKGEQQEEAEDEGSEQGASGQENDGEGQPEDSSSGGTDGPESLYGQVLDISELPEDIRDSILRTLAEALVRAQEAAKEVTKARRQGGEDDKRAVGGQGFNSEPEKDFETIKNIVSVKKNPHEHQRLLSRVRGEVRALRNFFENLGFTYVDVYDQSDGYDLVPDIERLAIFGDDDVFIDEEVVSKSSYDIQVIVDCSGSMYDRGKMERAKLFGVLTAEALKGLRGISCHFWGFTDTTIFDCGEIRDCGVSSLRAGGGNNDAAALWHAAQKSSASGKDTKILLMISDGAPTECSWEALRGLVQGLAKNGYIPVQVAVDWIHQPAFNHFVDLTGYNFRDAVRQFGKLLTKLVTW